MHCSGSAESRGEQPSFEWAKPWGPYSMPVGFEERILDYISKQIIKYQVGGTGWTNPCKITPNRHPYTLAVYREQGPSIQQSQHFLVGYSNSGDVYTLQNTCGYEFKRTGLFSVPQWYSDAINNYVNALHITSRTGHTGKLRPTNSEVAEIMFTYVCKFFDLRLRNIKGEVFDRLASAAVESEVSKCGASIGHTIYDPGAVLPATKPAVINQTASERPILVNRAAPAKPVRRPVITRNQARPVQPIRRR